MRNLALLDSLHCNVGVTGCNKLTYDTLNEVVYFATDLNVYGFLPKDRQTFYCISLEDGGYMKKDDYNKIINIHYMSDQAELCIITSKGDCLIWKSVTGILELMGTIESGITCSLWSPDNELLVITTGSGTYLLMSSEFDVICEHPIHIAEFGEAEHVIVGWGKKETQFHGSEGKEAAQQKQPQESRINSWDDYRTEITWRGDGQLFAITSVDQVRGCRCIRVYNREGILQSTSEVIQGMEGCIAWRPSGNLIACSQRKPNKHDVIFLEKNGLQHGQFTLPFSTLDKVILCMSWNMDSDILMILLTDMGEKTKNFVVQLWTVGNYHWYLKQESSFQNQNHPPSLLWDEDSPYKIHIICDDGSYYQNLYTNIVNQSSGVNNKSMVAVTDGKKLLLTPFKLMVIPPPMAASTITLANTPNLITFGVGSKQHDLLVRMSDDHFTYLSYSSDGQYKVIPVLTAKKLFDLKMRHLIWFQDSNVSAVTDNQSGSNIILMELLMKEDVIELKLKDQLQISSTVHVLFKNNCGSLYIENAKGGIYEIILNGDSKLDQGELFCSLPMLCSSIACTIFEDKLMVFGLTNQYRLFMNEKEIAANCTSFFVHDEFLLLTTHTHTLRCINLNSLLKVSNLRDESLCFDEASRRVERGSRLVTTIAQGTLTVLQMPRGNLESIHPRALVISCLKKLLSNLEYAEAMTIMRKHRINLNLFYDHNPELFLANIDRFISEMESVNYINLFLADLLPEDVCTTLYLPLYYGTSKLIKISPKDSLDKVNLICKNFQEIIEKKTNKNRLLLPLLTTYARQNDLESVLLKIKELRENPLTSPDAITYTAALVYILYLVDVNALFDIALGLYDFDLVILVAEKSQKDPKEYIPFLNNFKNMDEFYMKYSIDKYLKRYSKALISISKCENCFDECIKFVKEHRLYKQALQLFETTSIKYKKISMDYASYLEQQRLYEDAAIVYSRCGYRKQALEQFSKTKNWSMVLTEAKLLEYSPHSFMTLCRNLSERLKSEHMYKEAADILEQHVKDIEESVICLLKGGLWFNAIHLIHKYDREDLIETNLKPSILECCDLTEAKITDLQTRFMKHTNRLNVVVANKEKKKLEISEGIHDEAENDLFSDTTSVTGNSTSSTSSRGSRSSSGHSSKSQKKVNRKKYSLKEGGAYEEFALREALAEIINIADKMKEEVSELLKVMCLYYYEDKAKIIQQGFETLINTIESHIKQIWTENIQNSTDINSCQYGPSATVQSILTQRKTVKENDLSTSVQPTMRPNVQWKVHMLRI